jgi:hypothetical protein
MALNSCADRVRECLLLEVDRKTCTLSEPYRFGPKVGILYGGWKASTLDALRNRKRQSSPHGQSSVPSYGASDAE